MAAPSMTFNASGNITNALSVTHGTTSSNTSTIDASTKFELILQVANAGGTAAAATNGCQVSWFAVVAGGTTVDNQASGSVVIPTTASATNTLTIRLPTGKWQLNYQNLDVTNSVNNNITVTTTSATIDAIA